MKVMFDTNIYLSWIREELYGDLLLERGTVKYLSAIVLMELWAGAKTKKSTRLIEVLQKPYLKADRVVPLRTSHYITLGQFVADLPASYKDLTLKTGFVNDVQIALTAISIGAILYTGDNHYKLIKKAFKELKVEFV